MTITRLSGGLTPGNGSDPRTFPEIFNAAADVIEAQGTAIADLEALNPVQFGTAVPSDGQVLAYSTAVSGYDPVDIVSGPGDNLLYNGAMQVHQRGTAVTGIIGNGYYTADRWLILNNSLGTWTQTVENDAPTGSGFQKSVKMLCTTANAAPSASSQIFFRQELEGQDLQRIAKGTSSARQLTCSFWVKSNVTGTYILELWDRDNTRQVSASYAITSSATWEKKTITFPADSIGAFDNDNASSLFIAWWLGSGSDFASGTLNTVWATSTNANRAVGQTNLGAATNNYWQITGVQLEVGAVETPFEFKPYGQELLECQRYYYRVFPGETNKTLGASYNTTTGSATGVLAFPVTMRTRPTALEQSGTANQYAVVYDNFVFAACTSVPTLSAGTTRETGAWIFTTAAVLTAGHGSQCRTDLTNGAGAYLGWSAEL